MARLIGEKIRRSKCGEESRPEAQDIYSLDDRIQICMCAIKIRPIRDSDLKTVMYNIIAVQGLLRTDIF